MSMFVEAKEPFLIKTTITDIVLKETEHYFTINDLGEKILKIKKSGIMKIKKILSVKEEDIEVFSVDSNVCSKVILKMNGDKYIGIGSCNNTNTYGSNVKKAYMAEMATNRAYATCIIKILLDISDLDGLIYSEYDYFPEEKPQNSSKKKLDEIVIPVKGKQVKISSMDLFTLYCFYVEENPYKDTIREYVEKNNISFDQEIVEKFTRIIQKRQQTISK